MKDMKKFIVVLALGILIGMALFYLLINMRIIRPFGDFGNFTRPENFTNFTRFNRTG